MADNDGSGPPSMGIPQPPEAGLQATVMYDIRPTSGPMVPLHQLPPDTGTKPLPKRKRTSVSWTQTMDKELISLFHSARADSPMKAQGTLARGHWGKIANVLGLHFNLALKGQQARSRFGILKKKQALWTQLKGRDGFELHNDEITAHPSEWAAASQEDPDFLQFKGRPYPYGDAMWQALYGPTDHVKTISDVICSMDTSNQQRQARHFGYDTQTDFMQDYRMLPQQGAPFEPNASAVLHTELAKMFDAPGAPKDLQDALNEEQNLACMKAIELSDLEERRLAAALAAYHKPSLRLACMERMLGLSFDTLREYHKSIESEYADPTSTSLLGKREGSPLTGLISTASPSQLKKPRN